MFTIFQLLSDGVVGSGWCALSLLACGLLRLTAGVLLPGGWRAALRSLLVPALLCDLSWHAVFYPAGGYANQGQAAIQVFLLWPVFLVVSLFFQRKSRRST